MATVSPGKTRQRPTVTAGQLLPISSVLQGTELAASSAFVLSANTPIRQHLTVPLDRPAGGNVEVPPGSLTSTFTYSPNDASVGDDDGDTSPDWEITGPLSVNLRAERSGTGTGRIYTIEVEGRDAAGNTTLQTVSVTVPVGRP